MITTLIAAASLVMTPAPEIDRIKLLDAIEQVEGHRWSDPGGAFAIQPTTWKQHSRLPYRFASERSQATVIAERHLAWLGRSLLADGYPVTVYTLAACWRFGFEGYKARRHRQIDYATRVQNLYHAWPRSLP